MSASTKCVIAEVYIFFTTIGSTDYINLLPIEFVTNAEIQLFTSNDDITLEYNDTVILRFTPDNPLLIAGVQDAGEYIRDTAIVYIIDNDSKLCITV